MHNLREINKLCTAWRVYVDIFVDKAVLAGGWLRQLGAAGGACEADGFFGEHLGSVDEVASDVVHGNRDRDFGAAEDEGFGPCGFHFVQGLADGLGIVVCLAGFDAVVDHGVDGGALCFSGQQRFYAGVLEGALVDACAAGACRRKQADFLVALGLTVFGRCFDHADDGNLQIGQQWWQEVVGGVAGHDEEIRSLAGQALG